MFLKIKAFCPPLGVLGVELYLISRFNWLPEAQGGGEVQTSFLTHGDGGGISKKMDFLPKFEVFVEKYQKINL